jgi:hypothetical protein
MVHVDGRLPRVLLLVDRVHLEGVMKRDKVAHEPRVCPGCLDPFTPARADAKTCSARCKKRVQRDQYVVTAEDRAAIRRVLADGCGHPLERPPTPDEVRAHILATAVRT